MNEIILIVWLIFCGTVGIVLWISMLNILYSKGENVNSFFVLPGQYIRFWKIINKEEEKPKRNKYLIIFWIQIALLPIFIIGGILIIKNII